MVDAQPEPMFRVAFPGPFSHHDVVVNGWRVPFLTSELVDEERVVVVLDRRLGIELTAEEAERMLPFVADAIAVALGYGAHPDYDAPQPLLRAPYPRPERMRGIAVLDADTPAS